MSVREAYGVRLLFDQRFLRIALAVVLGLTLFFRVLQLLALTGDEYWGFDLSSYTGSGQRVLDGQSPYRDFQLEGSYQPQGPRGLYTYPPFLAAVFVPAAAVFDSDTFANWFWLAFGAALLAIVVVGVAHREHIADGWDLVLLLMAAFAFAPVQGELFIGNVHLLLLGLLGGAHLALCRGTRAGELIGGALIATAAMVKIFPGLMIVWLLLARRFRAVWASIVTLIALVLVTLPVTGFQPWLDYPTVLMNLGPPVEFGHVLAPSAWLWNVMPEPLARAVVLTTAAILLIFATFRRTEPVSYAVAVALSILSAPALYHHYLAIMILPLLIGLRHTTNVAWVFLAFILMSVGGQSIEGDAMWLGSRVFPTLGALLVVAGLLVWGERRTDAEPTTAPRARLAPT
jgi:alpha-1,2-mannosyltransferase